jgi:hypothetical protein
MPRSGAWRSCVLQPAGRPAEKQKSKTPAQGDSVTKRKVVDLL